MNRLINYLIYLFVIVVIIFGFVQLNNENTVFADSRAACCAAGYCEVSDCDATSTVRIGPSCTEYVLTCWDCIDFYEVCYNASRWCWHNGQKVYASDYSE